MAHMGTMDRGFTVTDITIQWNVIPKERRATCNLYDLTFTQKSCWSFTAPGMRHCVTEWVFPDILKIITLSPSRSAPSLYSIKHTEWVFPDILKIITLSPSRSAPSPYSIKQCPFLGKHPRPRPLWYLPHLARQPHRPPAFHTHIYTVWDLCSFHMPSWTAGQTMKASWYLEVSETCSHTQSVTSHNSSIFKMYCIYNWEL